MANENCLYDRWMDGEERNLNRFTLTLFQLYQNADGTNKSKICKHGESILTALNMVKSLV